MPISTKPKIGVGDGLGVLVGRGVLVGFGVLGWILKRVKWPRPPLALGMVLGPILGRYLFISNNAYGAAWLVRPGVVVILILMIIGVIFGLRSSKNRNISHEN